MNPYKSLRDYEEFIYTLQQQFPTIVFTTLTVIRRGGRMVTVAGELVFSQGYRLIVKERLTFDAGPLVLKRYGYETWHDNEKLFWYDSQPHPNDPTLAATAPHHKHIPPNIKRHRVPAPEISFTRPNLPFLIQEIEQLLKS